jgi:hypothetical protein
MLIRLSSLPAKNILIPFSEMCDCLSPFRLGKRGVCAIFTTREAGCDGRNSDARFTRGRTALMRT